MVAMSQAIFGMDIEADSLVWESITNEVIHSAAQTLLDENTAQLRKIGGDKVAVFL